MLVALLALLALASYAPQRGDARHKHFQHRVPIIDLDGADQLIGTVREDERIVTVSPQLRILHGTGPICRYDLSWADDADDLGAPVPFEARVTDTAAGTAQIRHRDAANALDCAAKAEYRVRVHAVKCGDDAAKSEAVELRISVQDVNNHAPEFDAPWYSFDVDEGAPHVEIARLYATDKDCGHPYGKVCRYELTNTLPGNPFHIDERGVLSTTRALNRSVADSHILTVVAEDCGMSRSKSVLVTVHVRARCVDAVQAPGAVQARSLSQTDTHAARLAVFPEAEVHACGSDACTAEADVELELRDEKQHLVEADALSECGMEHADAVELLPEGNGKARRMERHAEAEERDDEAEDAKWAFDGKTEVSVADERMPKTVPEHFSLLFSMRTEAGTEEQQRQKQNIICETDAKGLNRHHFAVYVRRCKLELLLRREPEHSSAEFRAAEWRWNDARICDGEWHRYALLFENLDNVQLLIDGVPFNASERNPEILDDWPLHEVKNKHTKLAVGACWHGRQSQHVQFFNGHLSSVWLWPGRVQAARAVACAHAQHERLALDDALKLEQGQAARFTSVDRTQLHLHAASAPSLARLLRAVHFSLDPLVEAGARVAPSIREGTRRVTLSAQLVCSALNISRPLAPLRTTIDVARASDRPQLAVTGRHLVNADQAALKSGAALLPDLQIAITQGGADVTGGYKLDWCRVHMRPARDMDLELFSSPTQLLQQLNIQFVHDKQGFALKGAEAADAYARVLSHIHYFNLRPEAFPHRSYTLQCAMLDGKVLSNELFTTMKIESGGELDDAVQKLVQLTDKLDRAGAAGSEEAKKKPADGQAKHHSAAVAEEDPMANFDGMGASNRLQNILEMDLPRPKALKSHNSYEMGQGAIAGGAVAVVVVICVGFLLVLLVIGIVKMRDSPLPGRRRGSRRDSLLEWDDNGMMNITVNPLEDVGKQGGDAMLDECSGAEDEEEEEEDDEEEGDSGSEEGAMDREPVPTDDEDDADGQQRVLPLVEGGRRGAGLEWDDSTDEPSTPGGSRPRNNNRRGGYRV